MNNKSWKLLSIIILVTILVTLIVTAIFISHSKKEKESTSISSKEKVLPKQRTDSELKTFWANEVQGIIYDQLAKGKLPYEEINNRFNEAKLRVIEKTHNPLGINLSTRYHWACKRVEAAANITKDKLGVEIYLPALLDGFEMLKSSGDSNWREAFQSHIIILFMHEMEHIRNETLPGDHIDIAEESRAWDDTCRYIISPLAEKYHLYLFASDYNIFRAWKMSNEDTKNMIWIGTIQSLYGDLDGKTQ